MSSTFQALDASESNLSSVEIQHRLRLRYIERLAQKIRKIRKDLIDRNWVVLRAECSQLHESGLTFDFLEISEVALRAMQAIPEGDLSRAKNLPIAKSQIEKLILTIDTVLITHGQHLLKRS